MNQKILIVSINGDDNSGGVERVVFYLNDILSKKYSVELLSRKGRPHKFDKIVYPLLFSFILLFKKNIIIISNSWQSFLFPVDFSFHHGTTAGFLRKTGRKSIGSSLLAWMEKISAKKARMNIAVSENCRDELIHIYGINPGKIIVLNNFVNEYAFYPEPADAHNTIRILFSGRLEYRKGIDKLLGLAKHIQDIPGFELCFALNSPLNRGLFEGLKGVTLRTNLTIEEMRRFYASGDVLYFPSRYEGFSMATLEALSSGLPVIGSEFAVPVEIRRYDFVRIFEGDDFPSFLDTVRTLHDENRRRRREIHEIIARDFGREQYKDTLFSIIEKYTEGHSG
jgi:glycosyltransferase involved in cell wall biosynthesis